VIGDLSSDFCHRDNMVIGHVILIAPVVEFDTCLSVVRGIDVDSPIERMGRRVGNIDISEEWGWHLG
jgi:hypothetical protein